MTNYLNHTSGRITLISVLVILSAVTLSIVVTGPAAATVDSADRTIDNTSVPNGSLVTVTVDASFDETTDAQINDNIAPSLSADNVEITDSEGASVAEYQESSGTVSATYFGVDSVSLTYELVIPSDVSVGTTYDFSDGEVLDTDDNTTSAITGDETIEVVEGESDYTPPEDDDGDGGIVTAERTIDSTEALPGDTVTVTTAVTFDGSTPDARIDDVIDPSISADNVEITESAGAFFAEYQESTGIVSFVFSGDDVDSVNLTYEVTIPEDASAGTTYDFSGGEVVDVDEGDVSAFAGDETIEVVENPLLAYADPETGVVGPAGLSVAAADFRAGEIDPGTLSEVAAAFRSAEPVA
jgi:hypothetical protein